MLNQAPNGAWEDVALDFIIKLSLSLKLMTQRYFDIILIIIDRLIKYGYFVPYKESSTAEDLVYIFVRYIVGNHEILKRIISDRDKLFISKFWKSLMNLLDVYYKLSTVYHP
jgi:hypothetical protein